MPASLTEEELRELHGLAVNFHAGEADATLKQMARELRRALTATAEPTAGEER